MVFEHLLSPLSVRHLRLRNRIVVTAHFTGFSSRGTPGEQDMAYLEARAAGGAGLVVTEGMAVHPSGLASPSSWVANGPGSVAALTELGARVHRHGAAIFGQLRHYGRNMSARYSRLALWAPSPLRGSYFREVPHEVDADEIQEIVEGFEAGARRVAEAGLDGVELNAAHGFLLHAFLSPYTNRRQDDYGGSAENRLRLVAEVCAAVRRTAGDRLVVGVRLSTEDFTPDGLTPDAVAGIAASLAARGLVDYISLSQSNNETWSMGAMVPDLHAGAAPFTAFAREVRRASGVPTIVAGGIRDARVADLVLARGEADLVGMTRALIADPKLPLKVVDDPAAVRPCIGCNACWDSLAHGTPLRCAVNPDIGLEGDPRPEPRHELPAHVVVVGGGVAGLEAARVAAEGGQRVTLLERTQQVGGQVQLAASAAGQGELAGIVAWLERAAHAAGVRIELGKEATVAAILERDPDLVIVATGARPSPEVAFATDRSVGHTWSYLGTGAPLLAGRRIAMIDEDSGWEAISVAEHLARQGAHVEMLTSHLSFGLDIPAISLPNALTRLKGLGVRLHTSVRACGYQADELTIEDVHTGQRSRIAAVDELIQAACRQANSAVLVALRAQHSGCRIIAAGDCVAPRSIATAIWEGHAAGLSAATPLMTL